MWNIKAVRYNYKPTLLVVILIANIRKKLKIKKKICLSCHYYVKAFKYIKEMAAAIIHVCSSVSAQDTLLVILQHLITCHFRNVVNINNSPENNCKISMVCRLMSRYPWHTGGHYQPTTEKASQCNAFENALKKLPNRHTILNNTDIHV